MKGFDELTHNTRIPPDIGANTPHNMIIHDMSMLTSRQVQKTGRRACRMVSKI